MNIQEGSLLKPDDKNIGEEFNICKNFKIYDMKIKMTSFMDNHKKRDSPFNIVRELSNKNVKEKSYDIKREKIKYRNSNSGLTKSKIITKNFIKIFQIQEEMKQNNLNDNKKNLNMENTVNINSSKNQKIFFIEKLNNEKSNDIYKEDNNNSFKKTENINKNEIILKMKKEKNLYTLLKKKRIRKVEDEKRKDWIDDEVHNYIKFKFGNYNEKSLMFKKNIFYNLFFKSKRYIN